MSHCKYFVAMELRFESSEFRFFMIVEKYLKALNNNFLTKNLKDYLSLWSLRLNLN